jgi:hypothetical protein
MRGYTQNMPATASIRDVYGVGSGVAAKVFENAGFWTIADVRAANLDDVGPQGIMKRLNAAMQAMKEDPDTTIRDWTRVSLSVYNVVLSVQYARVNPDSDIPQPFRCIISNDWMDDPVITPDGHTYDRSHITRWLTLNAIDPMSRRPLTADDLVPNRALKAAIDLYKPLEQRYLIDHSLTISN